MSESTPGGTAPPRFASVGTLCVAAACVGVVTGFALLAADSTGSTDRPIGGPFAALLDAAISLGALLSGSLDSLAPARPYIAVFAATVLGSLSWRGALRASLAFSLLVAWLAQWVCLEGSLLFGIGLYAVAIFGYARAAAAVALAPSQSPLRAAWIAVLAISVAILLAALLAHLDVYPTFYFDEGAYLNAARMQAGLIEPGVVARYGAGTVYNYEQFQFQRIPLWLQSAALAVFEPRLLALRLGSVATATAAVAVAAGSVVGRMGAAVAVGMVALAATSPLLLAYARPGFYVAATVLHGALAFASWLWLERRWDSRSAAGTGALLGASLYFYQLSWFVPVLAVLAWVATPALWRRPGAVRLAAIVAATAIAVALPGLIAMPEGFQKVSAQTFDKAAWSAGDGAPVAVVVAPRDLDRTSVESRASDWGSEVLTSIPSFSGDRPVVVLYGPQEQVAAGVEAAVSEGWQPLGEGGVTHSPLARLRGMLARLFRQPDWESSGRWIDGPLLNPLVAPLLVLGIVAALRRRDEPAYRLLLVWVIGGALLPAVIGGHFPRRTVLMVPFAYALAVLPWIDLARAFDGKTSGSRSGRAAVRLAFCGFAIAVWATGTHLYFTRWDQRIALGPTVPILDLEKQLTQVAPGERVLLPGRFARGRTYLHRGEDERNAIRSVRGILDAAGIRGASCEEAVPFSWVVTREEWRRFEDALAGAFAVRADERGPLVWLRVDAVRAGGCATATPRPGIRASDPPAAEPAGGSAGTDR